MVYESLHLKRIKVTIGCCAHRLFGTTNTNCTPVLRQVTLQHCLMTQQYITCYTSICVEHVSSEVPHIWLTLPTLRQRQFLSLCVHPQQHFVYYELKLVENSSKALPMSGTYPQSTRCQTKTHTTTPAQLHPPTCVS